MPVTVTPITFDELKANWKKYQLSIEAPFPFVVPHWLEGWWRSFGVNSDLFLRIVSDDERLIGLAPLRIESGTARFIGSADVCDYLDFIIKPGAEATFFDALIGELNSAGATRLELESIRSDSAVLKHLIPIAKEKGEAVEVADTDVTLDMPLPATWDEYLAGLSTHQRHEVGRKGRRLAEAGEVRFDIKPPKDVESDLSTLIRLLRASRSDKAEFMTPEMEKFFITMATAMDEAGLLRFGHLRLGDKIVASVMCFDYNETRYLYNSGYEPDYSSLSVGLLSKVYSIHDAIDNKLKRYDYLKGAEVYKYHLGGIEMPISRAVIELK